MVLALGAVPSLLPTVLEEAEALWDISTEGMLVFVEMLSLVFTMFGKTRGARLAKVAPVLNPEEGGEVAETGMDECFTTRLS